MRSHKNVWQDRFRRFDDFWLQTNKQTEKQSILYKYFVVLIKCKLEIESVRARECYNGGV